MIVKRKDDGSVIKTGIKFSYKNAIHQITKLTSDSKNGEARLVSGINNAQKITIHASFKHSDKAYKVTAITVGACK